MKLFRTKSNASTPGSGRPNRLSRILGSNRSKVDVANQQGPSSSASSPAVDVPTNPFPSPKPSSLQEPNLPPYLPPLADARGNGEFIKIPSKELSSPLNSDSSIMNEHDMTRKLMDVESSFVPEEKSEQKTEGYLGSERNQWPVTRSVSPDRTERSQTYLQYGPGKVHHRTVTYNALDKEADSDINQDTSVHHTNEVGESSAGAAEAHNPRPSSQISQAGVGEARSQSRAQDQSFYTAASNIRSDVYETPSYRSLPRRKPLPSYGDEDELDYGDSPIEPVSQDIPSSPITAAALRRTERALPVLEPETNDTDGERNDETTPKQTRKRLSSVSAQKSTSASGIPIRSVEDTFYVSSLERPVSPRPRSNGVSGLQSGQLFTLSDSATNTLQRPVLRARQTSQSSVVSTAPSTKSSKTQQYAEDQEAKQHASDVDITLTHPPQRSSGPQKRQSSHFSMQSTTSSMDMPRRPPGLQNRQMSQFSTISSARSADILDYLDEGADYALQTGGAMSAESSMVQASRGDLHRTLSFGSDASSILHGSPQRVVARFPAQSNREPMDPIIDPSSPPETPRPPLRTAADPTDTVLAQHVRDIFVPETVAREYRANHSIVETTENQSILSTPQVGYGKNSLTLKEQNSKVDKLTKENFDLKLKIHFLYQALQNRSEEGVNELVAKNAHLQAELVKVKKENQSLRKTLRALEKEQQDQADVTSTIQSIRSESEDANSAQAARYEDEIAHFKDRAQNLEFENEKLVQVWQNMLNEELARRKQSEREIQQLRQENFQLKNMQASTSPEVQQLQAEITRLKESSSVEILDLQQEISRLKDYRSPLWRLKLRRSRPNLKREGTTDSRQSQASESIPERQEDESLSGATVVGQLKQENADLRREVGAQTSMLTSRNRERERLQQEIEDLKLLQRHGDNTSSANSEGILDRSVSQQHYRSTSRTSAFSHLSNAERDRYESMQARLRDENALLRMRNQDLQRDVIALDDLRAEADTDIEQLSEAIKHMEIQLDEKEQEINDLLTEMRNQEEESNAFRQELKDIGDSLNHVMDDKENTQSTIESLQKELVNANAELEAMERGLREAKAAKERMEVQQESSQSEISFLREEQEADKVKIGELESALRKVKATYRDEQAIMKDVDELGADAQRAREEARRLRKTLSAKEAEALSSAQKLDELEHTLRDALGSWDGSRASLLTEASQLRGHLEDAMAKIDEANLHLNEKEELIVERETLLDASNLEIRRLTDLINAERKAYKVERAELELRRNDAGASSTGAEVQLAELEYARMQHRRQLEALEQRYTVQLDERNTLLLSLWTRLSGLCGASWAKRHNITDDQNTAPTLERIATDLPRFNETVFLAVKHIDTIVTHFRAKLNKTEDEIWQDFQKLDQALQARFKRLEQLEKVAQRNGPTSAANGITTDSFILADLARYKDENKVLRRELKHLKQTSFSLPGLPASPNHTLDVVNTSSAARSPAGSSIDNTPRSKRNSAVIPSSALVQTASSVQSEVNYSEDGNSNNIVATASGASARDPTRPGVAARSSSALGSTSALGMGRSPYVRAPSFGPHPPPAPQQQQRNSSTTSQPTSSNPHHQPRSQSLSRTTAPHHRSATPNSEPAATNDDARWVLRLEELQKRLEKEREGRLLDRDGARMRLMEERREVEGLKRELARSGLKGVRGTRAGGVLGGGGRGGDDGVD